MHILTNSVRSKIFDFNSFVSSIDIYKVMADPDSVPYDKDHGHNLTGDLRIIKSNRLRDLICKGPKSRESKAVDFALAIVSRESLTPLFYEDCIAYSLFQVLSTSPFPLLFLLSCLFGRMCHHATSNLLFCFIILWD